MTTRQIPPSPVEDQMECLEIMARTGVMPKETLKLLKKIRNRLEELEEFYFIHTAPEAKLHEFLPKEAEATTVKGGAEDDTFLPATHEQLNEAEQRMKDANIWS